MSGMYLRRRIPNAPQDPTMTYVDDPHAFHEGEFIRSYSGVHLIMEIEDARFGDPDIRFAYLLDAPIISDGGVVHDVRKDQVETCVWGAVTSDGQPITKEQARAALSEMYPDA